MKKFLAALLAFSMALALFVIFSPVSAQNVGVGIMMPSSKLDVSTAAGTHDGLEIEHTVSAFDPVLRFRTNNATRFTLGVDNSDDHFSITPGTSVSTGSPAFTVDDNGFVALNDDNPLARLHVENGAVLVRGTTGGIPETGAGTRMMWIPELAAFRAGSVTGTEWDNIGANSVALGLRTTASGSNSMAFGALNTCTGDDSYAFGHDNEARGTTGGFGMAIGAGTSAELGGIAIGFGDGTFPSSTHAGGPYSMALGTKISTTHWGSMLFGDFHATRPVLSSSSNNEFSAHFENGFRFYTQADVANTVFSIENRNVGVGIDVPAYRLDVNEDNPNGYSASFMNDGDDNDRNGIRIQCGADVPQAIIPNHYVRCFDGDGDEVGGLRLIAGTFTTYTVSDRRLKTNISETRLDAAEVLNRLRIVDFNWKHSPDDAPTTGFIAQEVKDVFPAMVAVTNGSGLIEDQHTLTPTQLIPVLVRGYQQLYEASQAENAALKAELEAMNQRLARIEAQLNLSASK